MQHPRRHRALHAASMAGGVAAAFLAVALFRGTAFPSATPRLPQGYLTARSGAYTLYAPSPQALREGVQEIGEARATFRARFGVEPGGLVVVLGDSPAALRAMDLEPLRRRDVPFLPFVTRAHLASAPAEDEVFALDGGALLKPVDGTARVVSPGSGAGYRAGLRAGDRVVGVNGSLAAAPDAIARLFQAIPTGGRVRLDLVRDDRPLAIEYDRGVEDPAAARAWQRAAARFRAETKTLGHEVCHQLVATVADRASRGRGVPERGYGHPALPDWVDEMAATLCESPAARERRQAYLRDNLEERIPLAELARMDHPVSVAMSVRAAGSSPRPAPDGPVQVLRGEEARKLLRNMNAGIFYAQALSLGEFISARGGPPALRTLTERLAAGRTLDQALADARRAAPSLPGSVAELEAQWLAWVVDGGAR